MKEILLVGNPNTGKTTLFNSLTGANGHTGNWHGVTVDSEGKKYRFMGEEYKIVDLPGIYSLSPLSFEEQVSVNYLYNHLQTLVINIVDINNLYRNFYLTLELKRLQVPLLLVVNKTNKDGKNVYNVNEKKLEQLLGIKVISIDASNKKDVLRLKKLLANDFLSYSNFNNKPNLIEFELKDEISKASNVIKEKAKSLDINLDYLSLKCLENDEKIVNKLKLNENERQEISKIQNAVGLENIAKSNYNLIDEIFTKLQARRHGEAYGKSKIDNFVLNKWLALPIFFCVLIAIFYLTFFSLGAYLSSLLSDFIQNIFGSWFLGVVKSVTNNPIIYDFFASGIIGGLGAVFSFLPQVVILYVSLGILEDSGYLSRVAFSLDDIFGKVGLSGKSVYTLLMGFGCSTTACMTARTMDNKNSKIKTAILAPYMSCTAKLPIYVVIGSAFFGASNVFVIFAIYLLGVIVALLLSVFYEKTFLKSGEQSFILEFPPYRVPKARRLLKLAYDNLKLFLIRVGSLLVSVNIIVWVLSNFSFTFGFVQITGQASMLETLGKVFSPIFVPLGFGSWGATSALIAGLVAKEIIVSTIAMINGITANGEELHSKISRSLTNPASAVCFTPASAISYMVFCLLYSPCLATTAVLNKEIGKKWTAISILVQFCVAYAVSFILYTTVNILIKKGVIVFMLMVILVGLISYAVYNLISWILKNKKCGNCKQCGKK